MDGELERVHRGLHGLRRDLTRQEWQAVVSGPAVRALRAEVHACPYTARGFERPRGYPGDAVLLDYMLRGLPPELAPSPRGLRIFAWLTRESPAFSAMRGRVAHFAALMDRAASRSEAPRAAAIACGHFREGQRSAAVQARSFQRLIAFDHDLRCLDAVDREQGMHGVTTMFGTPKQLVDGAHSIEDMDLIYAAGLYDFLPQPLAQQLTAQLVRRLRPGGQLVVSSFIESPDDGWMEACMDLWLVYRSLPQLHALCADVPTRLVQSIRAGSDATGQLGFLDVTRA
jgi:extracellular factor (EF) 3-hydroxypalmitic acid methyl ester biosynthesis protein